MCLLEVVADELVEVGEIGRLRVEPVGVALVELRAQALWCRSIDRLLHENVPESDRAVAVRPHKASAGWLRPGAYGRLEPRPDQAARQRLVQ